MTQRIGDGGVVVRETIPSSDVVRARFGDVDGLRALAIVAVVAYQAVRFAGLPGGVPPAVAQLFGDASQGFTLFLLLSAFSLAYPVVAARRTDGAAYLDIGRYVCKRLLRVYPAFLVALIVACAAHPLAQRLHAATLAAAVPAVPLPNVLRAALFAGNLDNDGFAALALVVRGYVVLPFALVAWLRAPRLTVAFAVLAAAVDVLTPAHAYGLAAVLPLVLGIAAADIRVTHHRFARAALPLAAVAAVLAFFCGPRLETLAGSIAAPDALRIDPVWSIALFGLLVGIGASAPLERFVGIAPLRLVGAAAYGISLVAMPIAALAVRLVPDRVGPAGVAALAALASFAGGVLLWQGVDRWVSGDPVRRRLADAPGRRLDVLLAKVRLARVVFLAPAAPDADPPAPAELRLVPQPREFYAPPPRPVAVDLAVLSTRTGSADELAAEILQTKARLGERSTALLTPPAADPSPPADPYAKPGFYRKSTQRPVMPPEPLATILPPIPLVPVPESLAAAPPRPAPEPAAPAVADAPLPEETVTHPHSNRPDAEKRPEPVAYGAAESPGVPVSEVPPIETPAIEPSALEAPAIETAVSKAPTTEAPTTEAPATEAPATEIHSIETSTTAIANAPEAPVAEAALAEPTVPGPGPLDVAVPASQAAVKPPARASLLERVFKHARATRKSEFAVPEPIAPHPEPSGPVTAEAVPAEAVPLEAVTAEAVTAEAVPLEAAPVEAVPLEVAPEGVAVAPVFAHRAGAHAPQKSEPLPVEPTEPAGLAPTVEPVVPIPSRSAPSSGAVRQPIRLRIGPGRDTTPGSHG